VKFQTYTPETITIPSTRPDFLIEKGLWAGRTLYDLYQDAHTPWEWHEEMFAVAREEGLIAFSTPFDTTAIDLLERLGAPIHKVASFEIVDLELIAAIARTGKPMIVSTGMASLEEIGEAVDVARRNGCAQICLLHCTSAYPTPVAEANLSKIAVLRDKFSVQVGLSDHTMGPVAPVVAIALGACVIEKHVTLKRTDGGPDAEFSLEMSELKELVDAVATAHAALGSAAEGRTASEAGNVIFRRSIYAVADIKAGDVFSRENVRVIRPGYGLAPKHLTDVLGKKASADIARGTALQWPLVS
jgi:N-acetylneuraminate synthase